MSTAPIQPGGKGVHLLVWAVPGASRSEIVGVHGDRIKIRVTAPPEGGRANSELVSLLERVLETDVELVAGMNGRSKVFRVAQLDVDSARRKLGLP
ncbi:MAG: DUF167 domain-containing protein [Acidimicrobiia bacterium]